MTDLMAKAEVEAKTYHGNPVVGRIAATALAAMERADAAEALAEYKVAIEWRDKFRAADLLLKRVETDRDHWVSRIEATSRLVLPVDMNDAPTGELLDTIAQQAAFQQAKIAELATELYDEREHKSNLEYGVVCTCAGCKLKAALEEVERLKRKLDAACEEGKRLRAVVDPALDDLHAHYAWCSMLCGGLIEFAFDECQAMATHTRGVLLAAGVDPSGKIPNRDAEKAR